MMGQMMQRPLLVMDLLKFGAETHKTAEIVSVRCEGDLHRQTYPETLDRVGQLGHALEALGLSSGDRVATLAWNGHRHFELYYACAGAGMVCHTINPRLSPEQMLYILGHAEDRVVFFDLTFLPIIEGLKAHLPEGMRFICMTDRAHMPEASVDLLCYEDLLAAQDATYDWPELDENTACGLCYTSGTTGNPKGALYSHRSSVLHAMYTGLALQTGLYDGSRILPVVPLFHVNAWGLPYAAPLMGASLIMPGPALDGASLFKLMDGEKVNSAWGVPTVWLGLQGEIANQGRTPDGLNQVVIGGSAAPRAMIEGFESQGVGVCHAWGMTEMSPIGTTGILPSDARDLPFADRMTLQAKQGRRVFGCELKIVDEAGKALPHDGEAVGELYVRGNAIVSGYFNNDDATAAAIDADGWFGTGDVAHIDKDGFLSIQDRAKDLIKSGGEWISSIDIENVVMAHPEVANCAVIAAPHPKWDERPLLVVVPAGDTKIMLDDVNVLMEPHFAKWQWPDDVVFVDALPLTATGKVSKLILRQTFADYQLPDLRGT
ncbi:MAG: long-chain-fatty-acid--CoA ligase [Marinovum sp.]|nr:long-chain-fatty-acid--CoA ligase [Marinovum sp.]